MTEQLALLILLGCTVLCAMLSYAERKDRSDPRIIFTAAYAYLTSSPVLWYLVDGSYYAGVKQRMVPYVLLSSSSSVLTFYVGGTLVIRLLNRQNMKHKVETRVRDELRRITSQLASLAVGVFTAVYVWISLVLKESGANSKEIMVFQGNPEHVRLYYLVLSALLVSSIAVVITGVGRSWWKMGVLAAYGAVTLANGERDILLVGFAYVLVRLRHWSNWRVVGSLVIGLALMSVVPIVRTSFDFKHQASAALGITGKDVMKSALTQGSSNLFVFSTVASWVPGYFDYRYGETYVDAFSSFLPYHSENPRSSLASWFKEQYARTGTSGYGFAMDAEAYLNFGWLGPPLVFFFWGIGLSTLYVHATRPNASSRSVFLWVLGLSFSIFAIRADSRSLLKVITYGAAADLMLRVLASILASQWTIRRRESEIVSPYPGGRT